MTLHAMNVIDEIRHDASGLALLHDWLGAGGVPVLASTAEARAQVCLWCPENRAPKWWETAKDKVAEVIRGQLEIKNQMRLELAGEDGLGMCRACGCCLKLKPWVPMQHIIAHTDAKTMAKFDPGCWILKEIQAL